jgi:dihydrofolate reductase
MLSIIVAFDENRVIGCRGQIPWHISADLKHFRNMTKDCAVILGRKTFESLPHPLPDRDHYVLTRSFKGAFHKIAPRVFQVSTLQWAIDLIRHTTPDKTGWVIGGAEIYRLTLDEGWVSRIVASEVKGAHDGDTFFPKLEDEWVRISVESHDLFDVVWYIKE